MSDKKEEPKKAESGSSAAAGTVGTASTSSATTVRVLAPSSSLGPTPIGPRHAALSSGGVLTAGPLSGPLTGVVRLRTPHPHDVLCGRGGSINSHPGNIRFREWVKVRKQAYNLATTKVSKARMCREVFNLVRGLNPPGRFLQRMDDSGITGGCWWMEINEQKALAKTSQALREGAPRIREMHKTETTPPPPPLERKRSNSRGTKRKAAVKEPPAKRAKRGSISGPKEPKHDINNEIHHPGNVFQMTPTSSSVARTGMPQLPFYDSFARPPILSESEGNKNQKQAEGEDATLPENTGKISASVTPATDFNDFTPSLAPVSPLFMSPIGNGSIPPEMNPPALSLGDVPSPGLANLPSLEGRRMKRSHSLENHELEGGTIEFQDPFKDESHILSGRALRSPRPGDSECNHRPSNRDGENRADSSNRSVSEKKVHNIIENDHDDLNNDGSSLAQKNGANCFCLCGTPGNHCICSDLADHLLHRSDGWDELNLISEC